MRSRNQNDIAREIRTGKEKGRYKECRNLGIGAYGGPYTESGFFVECTHLSLDKSGDPRWPQLSCPSDCAFFERTPDDKSEARQSDNYDRVGRTTKLREQFLTETWKLAGGRTSVRLNLSDVAKNLSLNQDEAEEIFLFHLREDWLGDASHGGNFYLTHSGLKRAEEILSSQESARIARESQPQSGVRGAVEPAGEADRKAQPRLRDLLDKPIPATLDEIEDDIKRLLSGAGDAYFKGTVFGMKVDARVEVLKLEADKLRRRQSNDSVVAPPDHLAGFWAWFTRKRILAIVIAVFVILAFILDFVGSAVNLYQWIFGSSQ